MFDTIAQDLSHGPSIHSGGFALAGLIAALIYSPAADWLAKKAFAAPPNLAAFEPLKDSRTKLVIGIVIAWILGGFIEEIVLRGIVLRETEHAFRGLLGSPFPTVIAIWTAAIAAAILHLYQGRRAALVILQISVIFGAVFIAAHRDLWAAILCHGLYDTNAFIRYANGTSRYSKPQPK